MPRGNSHAAPKISLKKGNPKRRMPDMLVVRLRGWTVYLGPADDPTSRQRGEQIAGLFLAWNRPKKLSDEQRATVEAIANDRGSTPPPVTVPPPPPAAPAPVAGGVDPNQLAHAILQAQQAAQLVAQGVDPTQAALQAAGQISPPAAPAPAPVAAPCHTVKAAVDIFLEFAIKNYIDRRTGLPSTNYHRYRRELARFVARYGALPVNNLNSTHLIEHREQMILEGRQRGKDLSVTHVNTVASIIRTAFRKLNELDVLDDAAMMKLNKVRPLQIGDYGAAPPKVVTDVPDDVILKTLPFIPPVPADMVQLQRLTGVRPSELFHLRACDLTWDEDEESWDYEPEIHKTTRHGGKRFITFLGQAAEILRPYLDRPPTHYLFDPGESEIRRREQLKMLREVGEENLPPTDVFRLIVLEATAKRRIAKSGCYNKDSYRKAVTRAVERANLLLPPEKRIPHWHPYQIRHTAATKSEQGEGEAKTQIALGHNDRKTTRGYTHNEKQHVRDVARHLDGSIDLNQEGAA